MAAADYESPYLDVIAYGSDALYGNTAPVAEFNTDIAATVAAVIPDTQHLRQWLYIKAAQSGDPDPDSTAAELVWLWEERISLSTRPAMTLCGSGGYPNRSNAVGTGILSVNNTGGQTILCRNDNADLTWAMLNVSGEGIDIFKLYWRGAYDTSSFDRPQCCIEQTKGSGVGTGALTVKDCTFDYFDEAIIIGRTGSTVCDRTVIDKCAFPDSTGTALVLNHSQAQGTLVRACKCECGVIVEANGVGQVRFEDMIYTEADQVALKIMAGAQNTGTYIFDGYQKIDTQFTGGVLVETDTGSSNRDALIIIRNVTDSRVLNSAADTTERLVKLYGNQICIIENCKGLAKIQVGGSTSVTTGSSVSRPSLPTVVISNCTFKGPNAIADARALLVKSDGTQAVKGVDYEDLIVNPRFRLDPHGSEADNISFTDVLSSIEAHMADIEQSPVPPSRTAVINQTQGAALRAEDGLEISVGETDVLYAFDFLKDIGDQRIDTVTSVIVYDSDDSVSSSVTVDTTYYRHGSEVKAKLTGVSAATGMYIEVIASYTNSNGTRKATIPLTCVA